MTAALRHPTGETNPTRQKLAALVLVGGAAAVAGTTLAGWRPVANILVLGLVLVAAWLVDGRPRRYIGPGLGAVAVGGGISLGSTLEMSAMATEHVLVYTFVGLALLLMSFIHPENVRGGALLLIFVGASAAVQNFAVSYNLGWQIAAILGLWGVLAFVQGSRTAGTGANSEPSEQDQEREADAHQRATPVDVGTRGS
jgi:hypothetical protein